MGSAGSDQSTCDGAWREISLQSALMQGNAVSRRPGASVQRPDYVRMSLKPLFRAD
jgi:hypothetical protein